MRRFDSEGQSGFTLLWALVVLLVVMIGGAIVIELTYSDYRHVRKDALSRRARWLAETGVNRFLVELNDPTGHPSRLLGGTITDTLDTGVISRTLSPWAGMLLAVAVAKVGIVSDTTVTLIGQKSSLPDSVAIRTRSQVYPLTLAGASNIDGGKIVSLGGRPLAGLFEGRGPSQLRVDSMSMTFNDTVTLDPWLLELESRLLDALRERAVSDAKLGGLVTGMSIDDLTSADTLIFSGDTEIRDCDWSPHAGPMIVCVDGNLTCSGRTKIRGLVKICVTGAVRIEDQVLIDGAAIVAKGLIYLGDSTVVGGYLLTFSGLKFTDASVMTETGIATVYKSAEQTIPQEQSAALGPTARYEGALLSILRRDQSGLETQPLITIAPGSRFSGALFANHSVELLSDAEGTFDVESFFTTHSSATYLNWIIDRYLRHRPGPRVFPVVETASDTSSQTVFVKARKIS